jgi:hypothetical protein
VLDLPSRYQPGPYPDAREDLRLDLLIGIAVNRLIAGNTQELETKSVMSRGQVRAVSRKILTGVARQHFAELPVLSEIAFDLLIDRSVEKKARTIGAGPLIVIDTDVDGEQRSKPEYSFFASSTVQTETPELPTLP